MVGFILSQVFGTAALILVCISYFTNNKRLFLLLNIFANVFYASAYLTQGLLVAGINTVLSIARTVGLFILAKNKTKPDFAYAFLIIFAYVINFSFFFTNWADLIVLFTSILFTIAYFFSKMSTVRLIAIIPNIALVIYNLIFHLYASAALNAVEAIVALVAVLKNIQNYSKIKQK